MRTRDENKVTAVMESAITMIVEEGFDGLSMQKLAKKAQVSPATIYIYFKNREDLLNQLYNQVQQKFAEVTLEGFNPDLSFEKGLWLQWKNRLKFTLQYPMYFSFYEAFRNSPLIRHDEVELSEFKQTMKIFLHNAIKRKEVTNVEPEIYWSVAYGSFYSLLKFHLQEKSLLNKNFKLTEPKLKVAFDMVIKALKP